VLKFLPENKSCNKITGKLVVRITDALDKFLEKSGFLSGIQAGK